MVDFRQDLMPRNEAGGPDVVPLELIVPAIATKPEVQYVVVPDWRLYGYKKFAAGSASASYRMQEVSACVFFQLLG